MKKTKQMQIGELNKKIEDMYSTYEVNEIKNKLNTELSESRQSHNHTQMCLQATQIQLATYRGMVDIFERFTDMKEKDITKIIQGKIKEYFDRKEDGNDIYRSNQINDFITRLDNQKLSQKD